PLLPFPHYNERDANHITAEVDRSFRFWKKAGSCNLEEAVDKDSRYHRRSSAVACPDGCTDAAVSKGDTARNHRKSLGERWSPRSQSWRGGIDYGLTLRLQHARRSSSLGYWSPSICA